jgi:hypothetical protein
LEEKFVQAKISLQCDFASTYEILTFQRNLKNLEESMYLGSFFYSSIFTGTLEILTLQRDLEKFSRNLFGLRDR